MTLITILGICATFFSIVILMVHFSVIGFKWYAAKSKKQKESDVKKMRAILEEIRKEDETKIANAINH